MYKDTRTLAKFATAYVSGALYTERESLTSAKIEFKNKDKSLA